MLIAGLCRPRRQGADEQPEHPALVGIIHRCNPPVAPPGWASSPPARTRSRERRSAPPDGDWRIGAGRGFVVDGDDAYGLPGRRGTMSSQQWRAGPTRWKRLVHRCPGHADRRATAAPLTGPSPRRAA